MLHISGGAWFCDGVVDGVMVWVGVCWIRGSVCLAPSDGARAFLFPSSDGTRACLADPQRHPPPPNLPPHRSRDLSYRWKWVPIHRHNFYEAHEVLWLTYTDKTTFVRDVVGQFQLVEGDHLKNSHEIVLFWPITFCIQCSPVAGLSGWMYIRFGISGSALPATIHWLEIQFRIFNQQKVQLAISWGMPSFGGHWVNLLI